MKVVCPSRCICQQREMTVQSQSHLSLTTIFNFSSKEKEKNCLIRTALSVWQGFEMISRLKRFTVREASFLVLSWKKVESSDFVLDISAQVHPSCDMRYTLRIRLHQILFFLFGDKNPAWFFCWWPCPFQVSECAFVLSPFFDILVNTSYYSNQSYLYEPHPWTMGAKMKKNHGKTLSENMVFKPLSSTASPWDHFEVTIWTPVTIWNPNFDWFPPLKFNS